MRWCCPKESLSENKGLCSIYWRIIQTGYVFTRFFFSVDSPAAMSLILLSGRFHNDNYSWSLKRARRKEDHLKCGRCKKQTRTLELVIAWPVNINSCLHIYYLTLGSVCSLRGRGLT